MITVIIDHLTNVSKPFQFQPTESKDVYCLINRLDSIGGFLNNISMFEK